MVSAPKKKPPVLLGPDGRPLDLEKYAPKPEVQVQLEAKIESVTGNLQAYAIVDERAAARPGWIYELLGQVLHSAAAPANAAPSLPERVAQDLEALTADLDFMGRPELPRPKPDLTAYADAHASAVRRCPHENVDLTTFVQREGQCQDCGRYVHFRSIGLFGGSWS